VADGVYTGMNNYIDYTAVRTRPRWPVLLGVIGVNGRVQALGVSGCLQGPEQLHQLQPRCALRAPACAPGCGRTMRCTFGGARQASPWVQPCQLVRSQRPSALRLLPDDVSYLSRDRVAARLPGSKLVTLVLGMCGKERVRSRRCAPTPPPAASARVRARPRLQRGR